MTSLLAIVFMFSMGSAQSEVISLSGVVNEELLPGNEASIYASLQSDAMLDMFKDVEMVQRQAFNAGKLVASGAKFSYPITVYYDTDNFNHFRIDTYVPVLRLTDDDFSSSNPVRLSGKFCIIFSDEKYYRDWTDIEAGNVVERGLFDYKNYRSALKAEFIFRGFFRLVKFIDESRSEGNILNCGSYEEIQDNGNSVIRIYNDKYEVINDVDDPTGPQEYLLYEFDMVNQNIVLKRCQSYSKKGEIIEIDFVRDTSVNSSEISKYLDMGNPTP
jgi:hypothetical protein